MNNIPIKEWKKAFAEAVRFAMTKDDFSYELFSPTNNTEELNATYEYFLEAFYKVFNIDYETM